MLKVINFRRKNGSLNILPAKMVYCLKFYNEKHSCKTDIFKPAAFYKFKFKRTTKHGIQKTYARRGASN